MNVFLQATASGIMVDGIYALIGINLTLILEVMKVINFCQGELLMLGTYMSFVLLDRYGFDPSVVIPIVTVAMLVFGALLQSTLITRPLHDSNDTNALSSTIGLGILFQNVVFLYFKSDYRIAQSVFSEKIVQLGAISLSLLKVLSSMILLAVTIFLLVFLKYANTGKQIHATSQDNTGAQACGIKTKLAYATTYGLGAAIAGIIGTCLMSFCCVFPTAGTVCGTRSLIVVTMGGLGSIIGTFINGIISGLMETVGAVVVGSPLKDIVVFLAFILILVVEQTVKTRWEQIAMKEKIGSRQILLSTLPLIVAVIPVFIHIPYSLSICMVTLYMASASSAWSILGGLTSQVPLGHAPFMGLDAYMSTLLLVKPDVPPRINTPLVLLLMGALTALLLSPCLVLRGSHFSLVTTVFGEAFRNLATNWDFAGKGQRLLLPFGNNPPALLRFKSKMPYFYLSFPMVIAVHLIVRAVGHSKFRYALEAVGEGGGITNTIGINPLKYKVLITFISYGPIAVCGVFYANHIRLTDPNIMIQTQSVEFVLSAVIGGIGSMIGPLIGTIILTLLAQYLNSTLSSIASRANLLVYVIILIVVILFQSGGIMGWCNGNKLKIKVSGMFDGMDGKK